MNKAPNNIFKKNEERIPAIYSKWLKRKAAAAQRIRKGKRADTA